MRSQSNDILINIICYADNTIILVNNIKHIQAILNKINEYGEEFEFQIIVDQIK